MAVRWVVWRADGTVECSEMQMAESMVASLAAMMADQMAECWAAEKAESLVVLTAVWMVV